jgi:predicted transglutaminase-like cysteine proteinase
MFGRVVVCSIAALLLVSPVPPGGETNSFASVDAPAASVVIATPHDEAQEQISRRISDQILDRTEDRAPEDAPAPAKVAALDAAEPTIESPVAAGLAFQSPALAEPFGLNTVPVVHGEVLTKWNGVESDIRAENDILELCRASAELCPPAARSFLAIIAQGRTQTGRARIGIVNRAINLAIRPMSDLAQWGMIDRWSAPLETLTTGLGDCEDYAIAKYVALTQAGIAAEDVRLVIVHDLAIGEDHAVVAARLDGDWIILDNRRLMLVKDSDMRRTVPLFVLDQTGVRQFAYAATPDASAACESASCVPASF